MLAAKLSDSANGPRLLLLAAEAAAEAEAAAAADVHGPTTDSTNN
jgi:hypothetical protein